MKTTVLALVALFLTTNAAHALEWNCKSADQSTRISILFDDGPGGIDNLGLQIDGQNYTTFSRVDNDPTLVSDVASRRSHQYTYSDTTLSLGFEGVTNTAMYFDIQANAASGKGKVLVYNGANLMKKIALTCSTVNE